MGQHSKPAPGFCTCKRHFPDQPKFHPPANATWHFLCDKPVLPPPQPRFTPTGTGWPDDPPEYEPDDAEAQRIAEDFADARAEQDRGL